MTFKRSSLIAVAIAVTSSLPIPLFGLPIEKGALDACEVPLVHPGSFTDLARRAKAKRPDAAAVRPRFVTHAEDEELSKLWAGEQGPAYFQKHLPEGVSFVTHELANNESEGIVKVMQQKGEFVVFRVEMPWNGKMIATNVTVSAFALSDNFRPGHGTNYLIGPSVLAAIDWGHGGGTSTTSGSTVDVQMNSLASSNIASIAIDQPQHGEGYRGWFRDFDDYMRFRVAFAKKYVHPDVPLFLDGHSYGGEMADMAFRRSDRPDLGLSDVYRGYIALSFVPDAKPGGSPAEKRQAEEEIEARQTRAPLLDLINPGDRDLGRQLMQKGKTGIYCELQCLLTGRENDWSIFPAPATFKKTGKPVRALYVMGEADSLVRGFENVFVSNLLPLQNAEIYTEGVRVSREGVVIPVGHMVFDHLRPVENLPEAENVIRDWYKAHDPKLAAADFSQQLEAFKDKFVRPFALPFSFRTKENTYPSALVLTAYYYNPIIRDFLNARIQAGAAVAAAPAVDEDGDPIPTESDVEAARRKYFLQYGEIQKKRDIFETVELIRSFILQTLAGDGVNINKKAVSPSPEIKALKFYANTFPFREALPEMVISKPQPTANFLKMNEVRAGIEGYLASVAEINRSKSKSADQKQTEIAAISLPAGMNGQPLTAEEFDRFSNFSNDVRKRELVPDGALKQFAEKNIADRAAAEKDYKAIEDQINKAKTELDAVTRNVRRWEVKLTRLLAADHPAEIRSAMLRLDSAEEQLNLDRIQTSQAMQQRVQLGVERGLSTDEIVHSFDSALVDAFVAWNVQSQEYQKGLGNLDSAKLNAALAGKYGAAAEKYANAIYGKGGEMEKLAAVKQQLEDLAYALRMKTADKERLMREYVETVLPDYFRYESVRVWDVLQDPAREAEVPALLEKAVQQFILEVWGQRPPPQKSGLY